MRRVLLNLRRGHGEDWGLRGRSEYGGLHWTVHGLRRRGLYINGDLTDLGRDVADRIAYHEAGRAGPAGPGEAVLSGGQVEDAPR